MINSATQTNQSAAAAAKSISTGKVEDTAAGTEDRFLKLLVAQMRNQDPLNPLDNAEVTSQLAQINTVRGLEELNSSVGRMARSTEVLSPVSAVGLLGRQVMVPGDEFRWTAASTPVQSSDPTMPDLLSSPAPSVQLGIETPMRAALVHMEVVDVTGRVVQTFRITDVEQGVRTLSWDGKQADGSMAKTGQYRFRAYAMDIEGNDIAVMPLVSGRVNGVANTALGARVELDGQAPQLASEIRAIL